MTQLQVIASTAQSSRAPAALLAAQMVQQEDAAALKRLATTIRVAGGETIVNEGDAVHHVYRVISGTVRLCKHTADGRRQIAAFRLAGEYFGLTEDGEYSSSAEAVSDVVLASYAQRQLDALAAQRPGIRTHVLRAVSQRMDELQDHIVMLGRRTAMERVAGLLLILAKRTGSEDDDLFDVPVSRHDMADYLGLTIETVCRAISDLKRNGIIAAPKLHQFQLRDAAALSRLAAAA
jgi:CRP/FNR family transcriptional regulator, nitrogen fixation regulation protein